MEIRHVQDKKIFSPNTIAAFGIAGITLAGIAFFASVGDFVASLTNGDQNRGNALMSALSHHPEDLKNLTTQLKSLSDEQAVALAHRVAKTQLPQRGKLHQNVLQVIYRTIHQARGGKRTSDD